MGKKRYHVNDKGNIGECSATIKCRFGIPLDRHFETKEQAQNFYETNNREQMIGSLRKIVCTDNKELYTPKLDTVLDVELLHNMIERGYVSSSVHPRDETLRVLCYTPKTQYDGKWNEATKLARGLIVQTSDDNFNDAVMIQRPWKKFFTLQQIQSDDGSAGWALGDEEDQASNSASSELDLLDFNAPAQVTDKLDGCFLYDTPLNLWDGGTISIGEIVEGKKTVFLIGQNDNGDFVPTRVVDWHDNGIKDHWVEITIDSFSATGDNKLIVTVNHEIPLSNGDYIPAGTIKSGDSLILCNGFDAEGNVDVVFAEVLEVKSLSNNDGVFSGGRVGYDITTETHNYVAQGVLVHNSMGVLYKDPDGSPALSTKGSFVSDPALYYTNMLRKNEKFYDATSQLLKNHPDTTFVFELTGKNNQIILEYDKDDISMIGAIRKKDGMYRSTDDYVNDWSGKGLSVAEKMDANNLQEAFNLPDRENREGVVVRMISDDPDKQMQIKIKQEDYLKLHRLSSSFSKKELRKTLLETSSTFQDFIDVADSGDVKHFDKVAELLNDDNFKKAGPMAQKFLDKYHDSFRNAIIPAAKVLKNTKDYVDSLDDSLFAMDVGEAKKNFAKMVNMDLKNDTDKSVSVAFKLFDVRYKGGSLTDVDGSQYMKSIIKNV